MTKNEIEYKKLKEQERSNRAQENLTRRGQNIKAGTDTLGSFIKKFGSNHFEWYNKYPELLKLGAALNFKVPKTDESYCGVLSIEWAPVLGKTGSYSDAVNTGIKQLYAVLKASGYLTGSWESPEIIRYILALSSGYSLLANVNRVYNVVKMLDNPRNVDWVYGVCAALGFTTSATNELRNNLYQLDALRHKLAARLNGYNLPNLFSMIDRQVWLNQHVFKEFGTDYDRLYVFRQIYWYSWDYATSSVKAVNTVWNPSSFESLVNGINRFIDTFINNDDVVDISATMLRAFPQNLYNAYDLLTDSISYIEDAEVLMQIKNATITGYPSGTTLDVYQKDGVIIQGDEDNTVDSFKNHVICTYMSQEYDDVLSDDFGYNIRLLPGDDDASVEDITRFTRFTAIMQRTDSSGHWMVESSGTEIVCAIQVISHNGIGMPVTLGAAISHTYCATANSTTINPIKALSQFTYHPDIVVMDEQGSDIINDKLNVNYSSLWRHITADDVEKIQLIHYPVILSEIAPLPNTSYNKDITGGKGGSRVTNNKRTPFKK